MSDLSGLFIPASTRNIPFRPLNRGMMRHLPSQGMPKEACWTAQNFWAQTQGLYRRPGYELFGGTAGTGKELPMRDMVTYFSSGGVQETVAIDDDNLFVLTFAGFTQKNSEYSTGSGTVGGTNGANTLTGTGTAWATAANNISVGDRVILDSNGSMTNPGPHTYYIGTITDATTLELVDSDGIDIEFPETFTNEDYKIQRCWITNRPYYVDWIVADNMVLFAENGRMPWSWDGATWGAYNSTDVAWQATCVGYHGDRVWFGDILDGATRYRQRLRWSKITDHDSFPAANYVDLNQTSGAILRIVPLEDWFIAYLDDAVYVGRPTNYVGGDLPYHFKMLETLETGLVGMKAVCKAHRGHYFVTKDNIWKLSLPGLEPIGTPIVHEALKNCKNPQYIWAAPDVPHHRVCFAIPGQGENFEKIWSYDYQSKSWSFEAVEGASLSFRGITFTYGWDDIESAISAANWDTGMADFASWDAIGAEKVAGELYIGTAGGAIHRLTNDATQDPGSIGIEAIFETGDIDRGQPNQEDIFERISLKIDTFLEVDLTFKVEFSNNRGRTWTTIADLADGTQMTIEAGEDEGFVSFKGRGSTGRFRFTSVTNCKPYSIVEWVLTCVGAGPELTTEAQVAT